MLGRPDLETKTDNARIALVRVLYVQDAFSPSKIGIRHLDYNDLGPPLLDLHAPHHRLHDAQLPTAIFER